MASVFMVTIFILLGSIEALSLQQQGVVNSSITIPCDIPEGFNTETVRWFINSSIKPFLTYFPKDILTLPNDHDPRFSITEAERLDISNLRKSDDGEYRCHVISALPLEDVESAANITVLDGCVMWAYSPPLETTNSGCSSGEIVAYAQQCNLACQEGFQLVGKTSTECQGNGELTSQTPQCEEVTCLVSNIPSHLKDKKNTCVEDAHVRYGTTCDFECPTGYKLNGNRTLRIICGDGDTLVFPQCEVITQESGRQNYWYIALIVFLMVVICIGIGTFVCWSRRKIEGGTEKYDAEDNRNSHPLKNEEKDCPDDRKTDENSALITKNEEKDCPDDRKTDENTVLITKNEEKDCPDDRKTDENTVLITTFEGFIELLRDQIGESSAAMMKVLKTLEKAELRNMPKLSKMKFCENKGFGKESVLNAFVWYVAEIVRCIDQSNPRVAVELTTDIISSTEDIASERSKKTPSIVSLENVQGSGADMTKNYFEVVHYAFMNLLVALRQNIKDGDDVKKRTTEAATIMRHYFRDNKQEIQEEVNPELKNSSKLMSIERTPSNWAGSGDGNDFFAKMCLQNIDKCLKYSDRILMRYKVLNIMIDSSDKTNGNKT